MTTLLRLDSSNLRVPSRHAPCWHILLVAACLSSLAARGQSSNLVNELATSMSRAYQCYSAGRYAEGIPAASQAFAIASQIHGEDAALTSKYMFLLATLQFKAEEFQAAQNLCSQSLAVAPTPLVCYTLAGIYTAEHRYEDAESVLDGGLALAGNKVEIANVANDLAHACQKQGKLGKAESLYARALGIREAFTNSLDLAQTLNDMANLHQDKGTYAMATQYYVRAHAIYDRRGDAVNAARALKNLAGLHATLGQYQLAAKECAEAYAAIVQAKGTNSVEVAALCNDMGVLCRRMGNVGAAEDFYRRALQVREARFGECDPDVLQTRNNLARLFKEQNRTTDAEAIYAAAADAFRRTGATNQPDYATVIHNLGELHRDQSNYASARVMFEQALQIRHMLFGTNHPDVAASLGGLGDVYRRQHALADAAACQERALAICEQHYGPGHGRTAESCRDLARVKAAEGNVAEGMVLYERALSNIETAAEQAGGEAFGASLRELQQELCSEYLELMVQTNGAVRLAPEDAAEKMLWATELARSRLLLDLMNQSSAGMWGDVPESERAPGEDLRRRILVLEELEKDELQQPVGTRLPGLLSRIAMQRGALRAELAVHEKALDARYPKYAQLRRPQAIRIADVQTNLLGADEVLLSYWMGPSHLFGIVITRTSAVFVAQATPAEDVARIVNQFLLPLRTSDRSLVETEQFKDASHAAYRVLLDPFLRVARVKEGAVVHLVPHGILCAVPFDALVTSTNGSSFTNLDYVVRRMLLVYVPSVRTLASLSATHPDAGTANRERLPARLYGDPLYESTQAFTEAKLRGSDKPYPLNSGAEESAYLIALQDTRGGDSALPRRLRLSTNDASRIPRLEGTLKEVNTIASLLYPPSSGQGQASDATPSQYKRTGKDASESDVKTLSASGALCGYRYLHFATHGYLPGQMRGLAESCIVLSIYGDDRNDGFLKATEVLGLRLDADMVVLSACNSGRVTDPVRNQGSSDMACAFFHAGAARLAVTLWPIADESTAAFMGQFYSLMRDKTPAVAMAEAKRAMCASNDPAMHHPFFWAPFLLIGIQ